MKNKMIFILSALIFMSVDLFSQSYEEILNTIEKNNTDLQAGRKYVESKSFEHKLDNVPEGPELSYGYFPNNSTVPGTKEVFEVSQSFQMPCYYRNQVAYSKMLVEQEELKYKVLQQNILLESKRLLIEYIALMKQLTINDKRLKFAEDIYNAYMVRSEVGDVNALELNKTKLHMTQVRKNQELLRSEVLSVKEKLNNLNGGENLELDFKDYPTEQLIELDSLIFNQMAVDPEILYNQKATEAAERNIKVTKNLQLPSFSIGYGTETVADEKFQGFMVGVSIPLWKSKRAIQYAKAESGFYQLNASSVTQNRISDSKVNYEKVQSLKSSLENYQNVLGSVNSEELLSKSLELGEISVIDFFTEMFYYYEVYDDYLSVEKEYHRALAELYKYRL
ncbi:MAG: TolC family protein [Bacteroidetes bacterium]|nr:TolC family protein [Bacteroidota bacterium]